MAARDQARRLSDCCPQEGRTGEALQPRPGSASSSLSTWRATARSYFGTGHHEDRTQTTAMPQPRKPPCGRLPRAGGGNDVSGHALNLPSTGRAGRRLLGRASARGGRTTPPNRASVSPEPISRAFGRFVLLPKDLVTGMANPCTLTCPGPPPLLRAGCSLWKVLLQPRLKSGLFIREVSDANQTSWRPQTPILVKGRLARTEDALSKQIAGQKDGQNDEAQRRGAPAESAQSWIAAGPSPVN